MPSPLGDIRAGGVIDDFFNSIDATGAPATLSGTPIFVCYKDTTTESTDSNTGGTGLTLAVDYDGVVGLNKWIVDTGVNTSYFVSGKNFKLVLTAGTAGAKSMVGRVIGRFSIENRSALMPTTAGRTLVVDAAGLADANAVKMGPSGSGSAQTARDIGTSVLLSAGTGTGQLDFTSGVVKANAVQWLGGTIPAVNVTGVPLVDAKYLLGTIFATPATAGIPDVNVKNIGGTFASYGGLVGDIRNGLSTLTQTQVSGGAYALTNATFIAALKAGLGTVPASGNWMVSYTQPTNFLTTVFAATVGTSTLAAGAQMDIVDAPNATAITAIQNGLSKPATAQTITPADTAAAATAQTGITSLLKSGTVVGANFVFSAPAMANSSGLSSPQAATMASLGAMISSNAFTVPALAAAPGGSGGAGTVLVNQDTGSADAMRIMDAADHTKAIQGATLYAYLTTDYVAGTFVVASESITGSDGRWAQPMYLLPGNYTGTASRTGFLTQVFTFTVA